MKSSILCRQHFSIFFQITLKLCHLFLCMLFISNATFINIAKNFDRLYNLYGPDQMPLHTFGKNLIDSYCLLFVYLFIKGSLKNFDFRYKINKCKIFCGKIDSSITKSLKPWNQDWH